MTDENFTVAEVGEEEVASTFVGAASGVVTVVGLEGEEVTVSLDATTVMEYVVPGVNVLSNVMVVPVEEAMTGEPPDIAAVAV
jgi:hypothetical protein